MPAARGASQRARTSAVEMNRQIQVRPNIAPLNAELSLRDQERTSLADPLDRPPHFTTEQLALMNLPPDTRHPGRPLVPISADHDASESQPTPSSRTWREILENINSHPRPESGAPNLTTTILQQDHQRNLSASSHFRGEIDSCPHQPPTFTFVDGALDTGTQGGVMACDLAARLATNNPAEMASLQNARDLATAMQTAEHLIRSNRATSTRKSYDRKVDDWKRWCTKRGFEDSDTVTENKLFLYLISEVIPKGVQTGSKHKGAALSEEGLDGYIKPVIALYRVLPQVIPFSLIKEQVRGHRNSHPHPRGEAVQSLVKQVIAKRKEMQKEKGIDRAKDTAMAFGVIKELHSTTDMLLSKGDYISIRETIFQFAHEWTLCYQRR